MTDTLSKVIDKKMQKVAKAKKELVASLKKDISKQAGMWGNDGPQDQSPRAKLNWKSRAELESILESVGIASYPNETDEELKEAIVANVNDGTLDASVLD